MMNMTERIFLPVLLVLLSISCFGQATGAQYRFIKTAQNRLFFPDDSSSFFAFYDKMDKVGDKEKGQVRVVHIGGSHVQAGVWSNAFVSAFQSGYIIAGGGYFIFPYRMAKTNGPPFLSSYSDGTWKRCRSVGKEFCQPLGLNALSISTNDSSNIFAVSLTRKAACRFVNVVTVYHNFNCSFSFTCALGDSLKIQRCDYPDAGYSSFVFEMPVDSVSFRLTRHDTLNKDFVLFGFSFENDLAPGFYLAALGANGASTSSFLRCSDFNAQLPSLRGDLFILSLGVNDTQSKGFTRESFIASYDSLIGLIKQASPDAAIILTTTTDNYIRRKTPNRRTIVAREATFELMRKHGVAVWDIFTVMGGYRSMPKWFSAGLASKDRVHFNSRGYTLVGNLMYEAVEKAYRQNRKK